MKQLMFRSRILAFTFVNVLSKNCELRTLHWKPLQSANTTSTTITMVESFTKRQATLDNCVLFVSDGAGTMLGCRNGLA